MKNPLGLIVCDPVRFTYLAFGSLITGHGVVTAISHQTLSGRSVVEVGVQRVWDLRIFVLTFENGEEIIREGGLVFTLRPDMRSRKMTREEFIEVLDRAEPGRVRHGRLGATLALIHALEGVNRLDNFFER